MSHISRLTSCSLIGVINVTPDSYVPGSRAGSVDDALRRAEQLLAEGADVLEIGGESTGPGSTDVSETDELRRVIPAITAIHERYPKVPIGIDTWKSGVARAACAAGASIVNDVTAGRGDPEMFSIVAAAGASIVLMYAKDPTPRTTVQETVYDDVIETIRAFLAARRDAALAAGIPAERIILDPGLGHFVSSLPEPSFAILARLGEFESLGCDLLLSPSRKSFLAGVEGLPVASRLPGTIAASAIAALHGARYIRTHDVEAVRRGVEVGVAVRRSLIPVSLHKDT